jgi:hypothetical protein
VTVGELIERLQKFEPSLPVIINLTAHEPDDEWRGGRNCWHEVPIHEVKLGQTDGLPIVPMVEIRGWDEATKGLI